MGAPDKAGREIGRIGGQETNLDGLAQDAWSTLQHNLAEINDHPETMVSVAKRHVRESIERFVEVRVGKVRECPWLSERLNPPPMDMAPCLVVPFPADYRDHRHARDKIAEIGMIPFAPPTRYFVEPPRNQFEPVTELDHDVLRILNEYGVDQLQRLDHLNPGYREALQHRPAKADLVRTWATWACDTRIDGVDLLRARTRGYTLNFACHRRALDVRDTLGRETDLSQVMLFMPGDLYLANLRASELLERMQKNIQDGLEQGNAQLVRNEGFATDGMMAFSIYRNVIDMARWQIEHQVACDDESKVMVRNQLEVAYMGIHHILQTCVVEDNENVEQLEMFHSLAALIAGLKVDTAGGQDMIVPEQWNVDYLDAFMAVTQYRHVVGAYQQLVERGGKVHWNDLGNGRSLFGKFESAKESLRQQLSTMAVLYLRMPEWQRETYGEFIAQQFALLEDEIGETAWDDDQLEKQLFVPTALVGDVADKWRYPYDFHDERDVSRAFRIEAMFEAISLKDHWAMKQDGRIEISQRVRDERGKTHVANDYVGLGTDGIWVDELGFLRTANEKIVGQDNPVILEKSQNTVVNVREEKPQNWMEVLSEQPGLLVESRLGEEGAALVKELLTANLETGGVRTVAQFTVTLERLLGRKAEEGEVDFVQMLLDLGMINGEGQDLGGLNPEEIQEALQRMREGKGELADLDQGGWVLLMMAATGQVPRELLVELVFKSYESLGKAMTLETVMAIEQLDNKRLINLLKVWKPQHPILDGRQHLIDYLQAKREGEAGYECLTDPEYLRQARELVAQVTKILHLNRRYDATMRSPLVAVLEAKENEQLVARCAVDGLLLTEILKFVCPELLPYFADTYGPESMMSLDVWYAWLDQAEGSGERSHGLVQISSGGEEGGVGIMVADATAGEVWQVEAKDIARPPVPNGAMVYGEVTQQQFNSAWRGDRQVIGHAISGGSAIMSDLAADLGQAEYALVADPDNVWLLIKRATDKQQPTEKRLVALDRVMKIEPQRMATAIKVDGIGGQTVRSLQEIVQLARSHSRWGAAIVAANILRRGKFFGEEAREQGERLYQLVVRQLATMPEHQMEQQIIAQTEYLTRRDLQQIREVHLAYELEIERERRLEGETREMLERRVQAQKRQEIEKRVAEVQGALTSAALALTARDEQARLEREETVGEEATRHFGEQIEERTHEVVQQVADMARVNEVDARLFAAVSQQVGVKALQALILDPNGQPLTGEALNQRLKALRTGILRVALELSERQLGSGSGTDLVKRSTRLEGATLSLFGQLDAGLARTAAELRITLPSFVPGEHMGDVKGLPVFAEAAD